ncbi:hypothetical protein [Micromonospora echinofusca]|uniref:Helix-turn-helix domain-containing protein n=1 Tax=Micromonospora echinofusca TaxID=47858 RepID=A0ABS3VMX6_MICEH|nr:hypothetical protein [Micromonospora echinofusca]MBO4205875.1 hypothetical protein [Micromonospora echinofusca]
MPPLSSRRQIGWMLRANRLLGPTAALRSGRAFARAYATDAGRELAPSQVTRWERGDLPVSRPVLRRYELLLGLPDLSLATVADAVRRFDGDPARVGAAGAGRHRGGAAVDRTGPVPARWHDLVARARVPYAMSGPDWDELTAEVAGRPGLVLHPPLLWEEIAGNLLGELIVAEGGQWLLRQEAMSRLLEHPDAETPTVRVCTAVVDDPAVPVFITPLSLLDVTAGPAANRYVLAQLVAPHNQLAQQGALLAAIRKLRAGHFRTDQEWGRLVTAVGDLVTDAPADPGVRSLTGEFTARLARALPHRRGPRDRVTVLDVGGPQAPFHRSDLTPDAAATVSSLVDRARSLLPVEPAERDDVFPGLVAEAVQSPNADQRLYATMLVAATPYRRPLATALLTELRRHLRDWDPVLAGSALRLLTLLQVPDHRELVYSLLTDPAVPPSLRHAAAAATPHWSARWDAARWRRVLATQRQRAREVPSALDAGILRALAYGLATDGHRDLLPEIEAGSGTSPYPPQARAMARWWSRLPPRLLDAAGR